MYSTAVKIEDVNDYLSLGNDCILPVNGSSQDYEVKLNPRAKREDGNHIKPTSIDEASKRVTVGISDCLSCSGCLTSSEDVLLKDNGYQDIVNRIKSSRHCIVTLAPQTVYMFAHCYKVEPRKAFQKLCFLFKKLGAKYVYDQNLGEAIALHASKLEFRKLLKAASANPSQRNDDHTTLPIISGHCPGWFLYAEKNLGADAVNHITRVPSSQHYQGILAKSLLLLEWYNVSMSKVAKLKLLNDIKLFNGAVSGDDIAGGGGALLSAVKTIKLENLKIPEIFHVATAPCYDKKIEAFRRDKDLYFRGLHDIVDAFANGTAKAVDAVLSTNDIEKIIQDTGLTFKGLKLMSLAPLCTPRRQRIIANLLGTPLDIPESCITESNNTRYAETNAQGGGYASEILKSLVENNTYDTGSDTADKATFVKTLNKDYSECKLETVNGDNVKFIVANGFRNIQNIVQELKKSKEKIHYIEVMACPGGCFHGAGQVLESGPSKTNKNSQGGIDDMDSALKLYYEDSTYKNTSDAHFASGIAEYLSRKIDLTPQTTTKQVHKGKIGGSHVHYLKANDYSW